MRVYCSYFASILIFLLLQSDLIFEQAFSRFVKVAKIVEGVDKLVADSPHNSLNAASPDTYYGPNSLRVLLNTCFSRSHERYEYTVCPFNNVTQKRVGATSAPNLLGVWGHWDLEEQSGYAIYNNIKYLDGEMCGIREKRAFLHLICDKDDFELTSVDDSVHCDFKFEMSVPLPCSLLKSAMAKSEKAKLYDASKNSNRAGGTGNKEDSSASSDQSSSSLPITSSTSQSTSQSSSQTTENSSAGPNSGGCDINSLSQSDKDSIVNNELMRRPESYTHLLCNFGNLHSFDSNGLDLENNLATGRDTYAMDNLRSQIEVLQVSLDNVKASLAYQPSEYFDM